MQLRCLFSETQWKAHYVRLELLGCVACILYVYLRYLSVCTQVGSCVAGPLLFSTLHRRACSKRVKSLAVPAPCQVRASAARTTASAEEVEARVWVPHHTWAGQELFRIAVDLRGFYLKARDERTVELRRQH